MAQNYSELNDLATVTNDSSKACPAKDHSIGPSGEIEEPAKENEDKFATTVKNLVRDIALLEKSYDDHKKLCKSLQLILVRYRSSEPMESLENNDTIARKLALEINSMHPVIVEGKGLVARLTDQFQRHPCRHCADEALAPVLTMFSNLEKSISDTRNRLDALHKYIAIAKFMAKPIAEQLNIAWKVFSSKSSDEPEAILHSYLDTAKSVARLWVPDLALATQLLSRRIGLNSGLLNADRRAEVISRLFHDPTKLLIQSTPVPENFFHYKTLKDKHSIRLIHYDGVDQNDILRFSVSEVSLEEPPLYDALSYVWGDERPNIYQWFSPNRTERKHQILCNDRSLLVTHNLLNCLRQLYTQPNCPPPIKAHRDERRGLWVDQICINQNDSIERSAQVSLMDTIYQTAHMAICWLGLADRNTKPAIHLMDKLAKFPHETVKDTDPGIMSLVSDFPAEEWEGIAALLSRPYFQRVWVVQEFALAKNLTVLCGSENIHVNSLIRCSDLLSRSNIWALMGDIAERYSTSFDNMKPTTENSAIRLGSDLSTMLKARKAVISMKSAPESIIFLNRRLNSTDPRDKFYGILGLVKECSKSWHIKSELPKPDYQRSVEEVYTEFSKFYLRTTENLGILSMVEDKSHRQLQGIPSWVPDCSALALPEPLKHPEDGTSSSWCAAGANSFNGEFTIKGLNLNLKGFRLDIIADCAVSFDEMERSHEWINMFELGYGYNNIPVAGMSFDEALWRTLILWSDSPLSKQQPLVDHGINFGDWTIDLLHNILSKQVTVSRGNSYFKAMASLFAVVDDLLEELPYLHLKYPRILDLPNLDWDSIKEEIIANVSTFVAGPVSEKYNALLNAFVETVARRLGYDPTAFGRYLHPISLSMKLWKEVLEGNDEDFEQTPKFEKLFVDTRAIISEFSQTRMGCAFPDMDRICRTLNALANVTEESEEVKSFHRRVGQFKAALGHNLRSRRLFRTAENRLGIGPQSLQIHDEVWVLDGACVPFIIRKNMLVGEAFVQGIMYGEAVGDGEMNGSALSSKEEISIA